MGKKYGDNIIRDIVVQHFDNDNLAPRPISMDNNARTHIARIVLDYLRQKAIDNIPRSPQITGYESR